MKQYLTLEYHWYKYTSTMWPATNSKKILGSRVCGAPTSMGVVLLLVLKYQYVRTKYTCTYHGTEYSSTYVLVH
jgi:hypothetical protein